MRIAIIGTGISGLGAAHLLAQRHEIACFEAGTHIGGHSHTHYITLQTAEGHRTLPVDTGFIVCNERTYPRFCALLRELGVEKVPTSMSFSAREPGRGICWQGSSLTGLLGDPANLCSPRFWRMLAQIPRFYREAASLLSSHEGSLGAWLHQRGYSNAFLRLHLLPMTAAIWSCPPSKVLDFPGALVARFLDNHGMLQLRDRPRWYTVCGGAAAYVEALVRPFRDRIYLRTAIQRLRRLPNGKVELRSADGQVSTWDRVVVAAHADQALRLLERPTAAEVALLGRFPYQANRAVLHHDRRLLPRRRSAWAAWNAVIDDHGPASLTYNLNTLQHLPGPTPVLTTLNPGPGGLPRSSLQRWSGIYEHPVFLPGADEAQRQVASISGQGGIHYAGAYWGFGFHEDGLVSGQRAAQEILEGRP